MNLPRADAAFGKSHHMRQDSQDRGFISFTTRPMPFRASRARDDVARRAECAYLATVAGTGRLDETDACDVGQCLIYGLAKRAWRL